MNKWGDGDGCSDGNKAYCCKSPLAEENRCYWGGVGARCNGDDLPLTFSGTVLSILDDVARVILRVVGRVVPLAALTGEVLLQVLDALDLDTDKYYCCPKEDIPKWKNCEWYGKPGNRFDGHCTDMTYARLTDSYFGGGETCGVQLSRVRTFCCESAEDPLFLPVPLENLFEHPPEGNNVDTEFSLETDKDSDSKQNPNDSAFRFVVLASPEELQVSLDKRDGSHWDVFSGCDGAIGEEGPHTVRMVCADFSDDSNCHKIGLGHGVPGTILQMPAGCGPGNTSPPIHPPSTTWQCNRDGVEYEGRLLVQALLNVNIQTSFGFTLIVTKLSLPLDLSQSYLTFYNKGKITGILPVEALAKVRYEASEVILDISFPGASFSIPGIAIIGPQLTVEGSIDAEIALAGKPKEIGNGDLDLKRNGDTKDLNKPSFYAGVQVHGDVTAKELLANMWANQAAREAAQPEADDSDETTESKERERRLIEMIDTLADVLEVLPPWEMAF
ncbi:glycosyl hydrolases family 18 protein [Colletotrichum sojae]|uniref:Glycosyl hydrolases family 18 protein n=1 Tax=Colletotrichum sojae TaxID=2175907 RepID=A0A8H6IU30_9PEZI|nr:glycosyl hydrolases family 18 protein [Colletotrichum sojae]